MPSYKINQAFWSFGDDFKIENAENPNDFYTVKGKVFSFGDDLTMLDSSGKEVIKIKQNLMNLMPTYTILKDGQEFAKVKKEFTFSLKDKFTMDVPGPNDYKVEGSILEHEYAFERKQTGQVAQVSKKFFAWTDSYCVKINEGEDVEAILACCIVIDQVAHDDDH